MGLGEIEAVCRELDLSLSDGIMAKDSKNGNYALHIAAQNGHEELVSSLLQKNAELNVQNAKGQTPLHMSVEYDFYWQSKMLRVAGAIDNMQNHDGHPAICGIDGGKVGIDAWDAPINMLKASATPERLQEAFTAMEALSLEERCKLDKVQVIQIGLAKKKALKDVWDHARFTA